MSNPFEGEITWEDVVAEISMLRTADDNAVVIVEGTSDANFFAQFVNPETSEIVIAWGKDNALKAIAYSNDVGWLGIICLLDRDFDDFLELKKLPKNGQLSG